MFICTYCKHSNEVNVLNVLIDQINLILEMLKDSLKSNFANNAEIYDKCLSIIKLFKEIPCNYKAIEDDNKKQFSDKETQYYHEENITSIDAEEIKNVAENFVVNSHFIYDERIGMYFDNSTSYYYDAEKSLYYDAYYGAFYWYNVDQNEYQYHSQIDSIKYSTIYHILYESNITQTTECSKKSVKKFKNSDNIITEVKNCQSDILSQQLDSVNASDCNDTTKSTSSKEEDPQIDSSKLAQSNVENSSQITDVNKDVDVMNDLSNLLSYQDVNIPAVTDKQPDLEEGEITDNDDQLAVDVVQAETFVCVPCIRMIVKESKDLKISSLYIVTCTGATIGREASLNHLILIPEQSVSKMHCSIMYNYDLQRYAIQDHATETGTYVNDKRIGQAKCMSEFFKIYNGDQLRIGSTIFDLHIHPRNDTCPTCEPGNLITQPKQDEKIDTTLDRKTQLNNLKKKYGLKNSKYESAKKFAAEYVDRSQARRKKTASTPQEAYYDQSASVDRPILSNNVGHRMLKNMGWKEGQGLGLNAAGITEPVKTELRVNEVAGLGSSESCNISLDNLGNVNKTKNWLKTKQRFDKINS